MKQIIFTPCIAFFSFACPKEKKQKKKAERKKPILPALAAAIAHSRMGRAFRSQPTAPFAGKTLSNFFWDSHRFNF